ncbi:MAG: (d)CMP kinase [Planctomycetes bacterium]|nr:(d)CMP kinase [Planctomycetota bacterium]
MSRSVIVTIDGPAGTGKSSASALLAERLGFDMLDTGAMYRAVALLALEAGIAAGDGALIAAALDRSVLQVDFSTQPPIIRIDGRDVHIRIRDTDVTSIVSQVASHREVRQRMVEAQRHVALTHARLVTEGRDQGTVVFPDAAVRIWLDARPEVRAHRRAEELRAQGIDVDDAAVLRDIANRDSSDRGRSEGPLRQPVGAVVLDTSDLSFAEVVDRLEAIVRECLAAAKARCGGVSA